MYKNISVVSVIQLSTVSQAYSSFHYLHLPANDGWVIVFISYLRDSGLLCFRGCNAREHCYLLHFKNI